MVFSLNYFLYLKIFAINKKKKEEKEGGQALANNM
jgi:hypothetical protein